MKTHGFSREKRLRRHSEFGATLRSGRTLRANTFVLKVKPNGLPQSRLGLMARKSLGNAVNRNRVKRMFREAFRLVLSKLPAGFDVLAIPATAPRCSLDELMQTILDLMGRAGRS